MIHNSYFVIERSKNIASMGSLPRAASASDSVPQSADYVEFSRVLVRAAEVKYYVDIDGEFDHEEGNLHGAFHSLDSPTLHPLLSAYILSSMVLDIHRC
jgi:hypothetical protein